MGCLNSNGLSVNEPNKILNINKIIHKMKIEPQQKVRKILINLL